MSPVGRLVFKTSEVLMKCLVGSTPTSSAKPTISDSLFFRLKTNYNPRVIVLKRYSGISLHFLPLHSASNKVVCKW
jgi:hypothetical protein